MATVNFYLKDPKSTKETPINMFFAYGNSKPLKYSTGDKVLPADWNGDKQMIREKRSIPDCVTRNAFLEKLDKTIKSIYRQLLTEGIEIDDNTLRSRMDEDMGRKKAQSSTTLLDFAKKLTEDLAAANSSERRIVKMAYTNLLEYSLKNKVKLDFKDMDLAFRDNFNVFLESKDYAQNSISTCFRALCIILNKARKAGINKFSMFRDREFSAKSERVKKFSFSYEELIRIHELDLTGQLPSYAEVRDLFLIGSFTAMRYSDFSKLVPESFSDGVVSRKTKKTGKHVSAPVHWVVSDILEKRNGQLPRMYGYNTINRIIKEIAKLAQITTPVVVSYTRGGERVDEVVEKWQAISTHSARRSGIRTMKKAGIPKEKIKLISGHTSDSSFSIYEDIDAEESALDLVNHAFFKKPAESL
ncbi:phage integrase SAM-like domain-containing protein [Dyadobacter sp. Leaf189]|uniref:phage integrase SAM-like domain-containing protein n=1 Tax=Dyadobacter sp. Leaf189 TaxID=1736295 RepID=UPI0006FFB5C1|nr:phage integrase SAM-like domain-containing protein [Dyadobacter sp. Leaf189]KQS34022.1 hypothetical protein ASG33_08305 [Dyadobacter sp. Leaf189]